MKTIIHELRAIIGDWLLYLAFRIYPDGNLKDRIGMANLQHFKRAADETEKGEIC